MNSGRYIVTASVDHPLYTNYSLVNTVNYSLHASEPFIHLPRTAGIAGFLHGSSSHGSSGNESAPKSASTSFPPLGRTPAAPNEATALSFKEI